MKFRVNSEKIRILFFADTHLGIDDPENPRIDRRRRGPDFFENYLKILDRSSCDDIDFVVHGGDLFYRSKVSAALVLKVFQPLIDLADTGKPVYVVPGNHERSRIPFPLLAVHPKIHVFHQPATFVYRRQDVSVGISGFPCDRGNIRRNFKFLIQKTRYQRQNVNTRILCLHQSVEGATVGVQNYTFRNRSDVVRGVSVGGTGV